jgi:hypothetical protein
MDVTKGAIIIGNKIPARTMKITTSKRVNPFLFFENDLDPAMAIDRFFCVKGN